MERDTWMVGGLRRVERDAEAEPGGDRVGVSDGARVEHGACDVHGAGSGKSYWMRGDRVGVGDIGVVHGGAWGSGDETYCVDRCTTMWKHESGMVNGRWLGQRDATTEQGGVWIGVSDGARVETWTCGFHGDGAVRADGMRGDRVAVGDIGALHGGARGSGDASCGDDGRAARMEHDRGILRGFWLCEQDVAGK